MIKTPGQPGAETSQSTQLAACALYRYDERLRKRFKTIELTIEETPYSPTPVRLNATSVIGVGVEKVEPQRRAKLFGRK